MVKHNHQYNLSNNLFLINMVNHSNIQMNIILFQIIIFIIDYFNNPLHHYNHLIMYNIYILNHNYTNYKYIILYIICFIYKLIIILHLWHHYSYLVLYNNIMIHLCRSCINIQINSNFYMYL